MFDCEIELLRQLCVCLENLEQNEWILSQLWIRNQKFSKKKFPTSCPLKIKSDQSQMTKGEKREEKKYTNNINSIQVKVKK